MTLSNDDLKKIQEEIIKVNTVFEVYYKAMEKYFQPFVNELNKLKISPEMQRFCLAMHSKEMQEMSELWPHIIELLGNDKYDHLSIVDLRNTVEDNGKTIWQNLIDAARTQRENNSALPTKTVQIENYMYYMLDKVNSNAWNLKDNTSLEINTAKHGGKDTLLIFLDINFDDLPEDVSITRELTCFDKYVYMAISTLFNNSHDILSITNIFNAMGYNGKPSKIMLDGIYNSILKLNRTYISINNKEEAKKYNYDSFIYDGSLLPCESIKAIVNGTITDSAIHIFREPPLMTFAKGRNQITKISFNTLQIPLNKTNENLTLIDYLLQRVSHIKTGRSNNAILLTTLTKNVLPENSSQPKIKNFKSRLPNKLTKILNCWSETGFIKNYTLNNVKIEIFG